MPPQVLDPRNLPESEEAIDFSDIEAKYAVDDEDGFENILVVDNIPIVDEAKEDKLLKVIHKIFKSAGINLREGSIFMPQAVDPKSGKKKSKGFLFVEMDNAEKTSLAIKNLNNYAMDKTHVLSVNKFTDIEKYATLEDEYKEPEIEAFDEKEHLRSWLADPQARDQWVMYRGEEVSIYWNKKAEAPEHVHSRPNWTETYVQWSPLGSYLVTFHRQGIALWGGESWSKIVRFVHPGVKLIDFSPKENYLVTWSNEPITLSASVSNASLPFGPEDEGNQVLVWDVKTGELLRSFPNISTSGDRSGPTKINWPMFKWSSTEKYFGRVTPGQMISVYEVPGMGLVDKKSIKIDGVLDFEWAPAGRQKPNSQKPANDILAYWTPEVGNQPARVTLLNFPSRQIIRTKNLFNVNGCKLHWHPHGHYLCVKVDRHTKTKKSSFTNLEIFRVVDKDIPVDVVEVPDAVIAFAWEPASEPRFGIISTADTSTTAAGQSGTGTTANTPRTSVSFYKLEKGKGKLATTEFKLIKTLERKTTNALVWSPRGRNLVLATLRTQTTWDLEFYDMDFEPVETKKEQTGNVNDPAAYINLLSTQEHYGVTDIEWDPTGRYVLTSASMWRHTMENGFMLWDFKGNMLFKKVLDKFKQILWRPRPKSLLNAEQKKKIRKNLKDYSREFDQEDLSSQNAVSAAVIAQRRKLNEDWYSWRRRAEAELAEERAKSGKSLANIDTKNYETIEEWIEEVIEETEEVLDE
ncbi:translation initiation factor eIF-3b [Basidiobolus meristosporus CBS 931.73]|uniref:Eukaryotic translation initiation factor 3 subunit B n=1 Tax=Basidiobolus meristosporus CBS 931.73 TaxID=1314790 RepID=A0A1Y1Z2R1_9FUNG|nr:translation initiation factor eIF-3b [Basidiobolus meristosporus CBS 931.73]|eukprot:ORY04590.1 translation initiation factor eIF-3b [Basidiobolus meristosporus CBS 931.73]